MNKLTHKEVISMAREFEASEYCDSESAHIIIELCYRLEAAMECIEQYCK
jgi:hypothetical protein